MKTNLACLVLAGSLSVMSAPRAGQAPVTGELGPRQPARQPPPADVVAPGSGAIATSSGLEMKVLQTGSGAVRPVGADCVVVRFTSWRRDGSIQSTSGARGETSTQCIARAILGVKEALLSMVEGEKRRLWIPAKLTYPVEANSHGKKAFQIELEEDAPPRVDLTFDLELVKIMKAPTPPLDLTAPPEAAQRLPSGVAFRVLRPGSGEKRPALTDSVLVHFSTWKVNGDLVETTGLSGHPALFLVGNVPPGWREGIAMMSVGERARFWVPAALAFGEHPLSKKQPAGNLVYDIELLAIQ